MFISLTNFFSIQESPEVRSASARFVIFFFNPLRLRLLDSISILIYRYNRVPCLPSPEARYPPPWKGWEVSTKFFLTVGIRNLRDTV